MRVRPDTRGIAGSSSDIVNTRVVFDHTAHALVGIAYP